MLSDNKYEKLKRLLTEETGMKLDNKRALLETRLMSKALRLGLASLDGYVDYVLDHPEEFSALIDTITTHTTHFFRDPQHFEYMESYLKEYDLTQGLKVWCTAASTGEEPYSIAMVIAGSMRDIHPVGSHGSARILATDISRGVLQQAKEGLYDEDAIVQAPKGMAKYMMRYTSREGSRYRIDESLRRLVSFRQFNLLDPFSASQWDIVFCRNVLIYFEPQTQKHVIQKIYDHLKPGGLLFTGATEILSAPCYTRLRLERPIKSSVYRKEV